MSERGRFVLGSLVAFALLSGGAPCHATDCPPTTTEICDGIDNDGDGLIDEQPSADGGSPYLCATYLSQCILASPGIPAQCADPPDKGGAFWTCAGGRQLVSNLTLRATGQPSLAEFCVFVDECGGCLGPHCDDQGRAICGVDPLPLCVCKGGKCVDPCNGVTCAAGFACRQEAPGAGTCQPNGDCRIAGGCAAGELCFGGACAADGCNPNPCSADEVCRTASYDGQTPMVTCETSCANVDCAQWGVCHEGLCMEPGTGCRVDSARCPPLTVCGWDGTCGDPPCLGVRCPGGQFCVDGDCQLIDRSIDSGPIGDASGVSPSDAASTDVRRRAASAATGGCSCALDRRGEYDGAWVAAIALLLSRSCCSRRARSRWAAAMLDKW